MTAPLAPRPDSCVLKFIRATEHFNTLVLEVETFFTDNPENTIFKFEMDESDNSIKLRQLKAITPDWSIIVGDCLYNLRSALEHFVWQIAEHNGGIPDRKTEYPIFLDAKVYSEVTLKTGKPTAWSGLRKVAALPSAVQTTIEKLQPYNRTDGPKDLHPIWLLHELSNHANHRAVNVVFAALERATMRVTGIPKGRTESFALTQGPLEDGAIVGHIRPRFGERADREVSVNFNFTPSVAFDPKGPGRGLPVIATLADINNFIAMNVIPQLQPFLR